MAARTSGSATSPPTEGSALFVLAADSNTGNSGSPFVSLIFFALLAGAMYMFLIRPQRARMRAVTAAQAALEPGREVVLTSGIYGTVLHVEPTRVGLEIAPGVHITVARAAVAQVVEPTTAADAGPTAP